MTLSVVLLAAADQAHHAHGAHRKRALERLGCEVTAINPLEPRGLRRFVARRSWPRSLQEALARSPDLLLALGVPELDPSQAGRFRGTSAIPWVNWFPDDLRTADPAADRVGGYDHLFVPGSDVAERIHSRTGRTAEVLPFACDPSIHRPVTIRDQQYRANVVFAGRATLGRELLLAELVGFGLALWGPGWRETALRDYCRGEVAHTEEFVSAYAGASVAVNIHHAQSREVMEASCNQRLFEIAAIGVPQVVDMRHDLPRWFTPGEEVEVFSDAAELRGRVEAMLHDRARCDDMSGRARERALREHTYMHRLRHLIERVTPGQLG